MEFHRPPGPAGGPLEYPVEGIGRDVGLRDGQAFEEVTLSRLVLLGMELGLGPLRGVLLWENSD